MEGSTGTLSPARTHCAARGPATVTGPSARRPPHDQPRRARQRSAPPLAMSVTISRVAVARSPVCCKQQRARRPLSGRAADGRAWRVKHGSKRGLVRVLHVYEPQALWIAPPQPQRVPWSRARRGFPDVPSSLAIGMVLAPPASTRTMFETAAAREHPSSRTMPRAPVRAPTEEARVRSWRSPLRARLGVLSAAAGTVAARRLCGAARRPRFALRAAMRVLPVACR